VPPEVPTGLTVITGDSKIDLTWTGNVEADLASYKIFMDGTYLATVNAPNTNYQITGLTNGVTYSFTLTAVDALNNESAQSSSVTGHPEDTTPPTEVSNLIETHDSNSVQLNWLNPTDSDFQHVKVYKNNSYIGTSTNGTYSVTGLQEGATYTFKVTSVDMNLNETIGKVITVKTNDITPPAVPTGLIIQEGNNKLMLSWNNNLDSDLYGYNVYIDGIKINNSLIGVNMYEIDSLINNQSYSIQIAAVDVQGNESSKSAAVNGQPHLPSDIVPPGVPTGLSATTNGSDITLMWNNNVDPDLLSYIVYQNGIKIANIPAGSTSWTGGGLSPGTYVYEITSLDSSLNESSKSGPISETIVLPLDATPPGSPHDITNTQTSDRITVTWQNPSDVDFDYVKLYLDGILIDTTNGESYNFTNLDDDQIYTIAITTVDTSGNESARQIITVHTNDATAPNSPSGITAAISDSKIQINWNPNLEMDLKGYNIYINDTKINNGTLGSSSYNLENLTNGISYKIQISAVDQSGNESTLSMPIIRIPADTTPPSFVGALTETHTSNSVTLQWIAPNDSDLHHFNIYQDNVLVGTTTNIEITINDLNQNRIYTFKVEAVDQNSNHSIATFITIKTNKTATITPTPSNAPSTTPNSSITPPTAQTPNSTPIPTAVTSPSSMPSSTVTSNPTQIPKPSISPSEIPNLTPNPSSNPQVENKMEIEFVVEDGDGFVMLKWEGLKNNPDIEEYRIYQDGQWIKTLPKEDTEYRVESLENGSEYHFELVAYNGDKEQTSKTGTVVAKPVLSKPGNIKAREINEGVEVTWESPVSKNVEGYNVYLDGKLISKLNKNQTRYTFANLKAKDVERIEVRSYDKNGSESLKQIYNASILVPKENNNEIKIFTITSVMIIFCILLLWILKKRKNTKNKK
jgi:hypothetical protein